MANKAEHQRRRATAAERGAANKAEHQRRRESTWLWVPPIDSVDRLTIVHKSDLSFHNGDTSKNLILHNVLKDELKGKEIRQSIVFDTIQKIYDRYFSIFAIENLNNTPSKKVIAVTTIRSNLIRFEYEFLTKKNDSISRSFIINSINLVKTIRFNKGI